MPSQIREGIGLGGQLSSWGGAAKEIAVTSGRLRE